MSPPPGIPTSRAYWELQADKLMNRIFDPPPIIELGSVGEAAEARQAHGMVEAAPAAAMPGRWLRARRAQPGSGGPAPASNAAPASSPGSSARQQPLLLALLAGAGLVTTSCGVLALSQWNRLQAGLQQERNLLLLERLRNFGPASQAAATPPPPTLAPPPGSTDPSQDARTHLQTPSARAQVGQAPLRLGEVELGQLERGHAGSHQEERDPPPPPPQEPWIDQLGSLPSPQRQAPLLRVPLSPKLAQARAEAPPSAGSPAAGPLPLLVGVVGAPGKAGSAIFQLGGSTSSVGVGEAIGASGWRLRATDGDSVLIEQAGNLRRIAIGSGG